MRLFKTMALAGWCALCAQALDLRNAVIVVRADAPRPEQKAAQTLAEEIAKRTQLRLAIRNAAPAGVPAIVLGTAAELGGAIRGLPAPVKGADGYRVAVVDNQSYKAFRIAKEDALLRLRAR